jgi:hypothetical protein
MKKLMRQSACADSSVDLSMNGSTMDQQALAAASSSSGELPQTPERTLTERESILGENIKYEFKKALANRRPST